MDNYVEIYTDGGARGNPGPASSAFIVVIEKQEVAKGSKFLGNTTNNVAEYSGVLLALDYIKVNREKFENKKIKFISDSELIVKQINGEYKVKNAKLLELYMRIKHLQKFLKNEIIFTVVPRRYNKSADILVNLTTDENIY